MKKILIIDDDESARVSLSLLLKEEGFETYEAESGTKGLDMTRRLNPDLVLCDINMPDINGLDVLKRIREYDELIQVIMVTAIEDMNSTISAMQRGAYDYIVKPIDTVRLKHTIVRALENKELSQKLESLTPKDDTEYELFNTLVGKSNSIREIYKKIGQASSTRVTVLIQGESGTGKELIAKIIHNSGITRNYPFIAINCTALPENLLESELFGHVKGAFTDAIKDKRGKFELAGEGTVFLDEISEMSLNLQAKLLRVLQEFVFERVGGENSIQMKARVIASTNKDLYKLVQDGKFREDLFYRLNVFTIYSPPLRERKEDIEVLVKHFLKKINFILHKNVRKVPRDVMDMLKNHDWKGNVRELENVLMQGIVLSKGDVLEKENLLLKTEPIKESKELKIGSNITIEELEKVHIKAVLEKENWNIKKVCDILGISKATLYRKIDCYKFKRES